MLSNLKHFYLTMYNISMSLKTFEYKHHEVYELPEQIKEEFLSNLFSVGSYEDRRPITRAAKKRLDELFDVKGMDDNEFDLLRWSIFAFFDKLIEEAGPLAMNPGKDASFDIYGDWYDERDIKVRNYKDRSAQIINYLKEKRTN